MEKTRAAMFASPHMALLTPLFESIPDQVIVVDSSCELLFMNRSFVVGGIERFGTTFTVSKSICNDKKKSAIVDQSIWARVLAGEEFTMTEEQGSKKSSRSYFEIRFVPIMSDKSKVLGAAAFIKDVSLLRKAEIDLIENRITLQETQAIAGISRWSFSIVGETADWDDAFFAIFGLSTTVAKNKKTLFSIFSDDEQKNLMLKIEETKRLGREDVIFDTSFKHPKSGKRYIHTLGRINGDQFIGVSHDITDIKAAQVALEVQNKELQNTKHAMLNVLEDAQLLEQKTREKVYQLNAILSSMREGLVAVDAKMKIVLINQAAAALFRIAPDDAIGKPVDKVCVFLQHDTKMLAKDSPLKKAITESTIMSYNINDDLAIVDQAKVKIPVACTASSLAGDLPVKGIMIIRDITKEKEIDSAKNELISLASHQLRTPLSSVNWYSEMLLSGDAGPINEEQKSYISEIYKGNQRMIALVNALLNVSRVDLGTLTIDAEEVSLKALADDAIADQVALATEKKLTIKADVPAKISKYSGDKKILSIIFQNLISNAVKYTPAEGKITIKVAVGAKGEVVAEHELKQDSIVISVADNGYGIPEKEKVKIFTKLYRANNVKEMETDGNGLGLYLVKTMINNLGGSIWFASKEKEGTTFYVALPAKGMKKKVGTTIFT